MIKRWMGAALVTCCFSLASGAQAQYPATPRPALPEPAPYASGVAPAFDPHAPMPSGVDYHGPSAVPGAFQGQGEQGSSGLYMYFGAMALERQRPGHGVIALSDQQSRGLDTGIPPPGNSKVELDFSSIHPEFEWGERATIGFVDGCHAVELTGFYLQDNNISAVGISHGRLSAAWFHNPPLGFEGDNGMFLQDDIVKATLKTAIGDVELNSRWSDQNWWGLEWMLGIRCVDLQESMTIFAGDDDLTRVDRFGNPDPRRQASYLVRSHNRMAAPQIGVDWNRPVLSWVTIGANAKGAIGPNFVELDKRLIRGDGFVGFSKRENETTYSQIYEAGIYVDLGILERVRVRVGYNALLFVHVPDSQSQVSYDFRNQFPNTNNDGSIFYHGPIMELQILF